MAHKWAKWLHNPCRLGGSHRFRVGGRIRGGPQSAGWQHNRFRLGSPHRVRAGGENRRWPTSGLGGYITPAAWGLPTASERGRIRDGPQVGQVAT